MIGRLCAYLYGKAKCVFLTCYVLLSLITMNVLIGLAYTYSYTLLDAKIETWYWFATAFLPTAICLVLLWQSGLQIFLNPLMRSLTGETLTSRRKHANSPSHFLYVPSLVAAIVASGLILKFASGHWNLNDHGVFGAIFAITLVGGNDISYPLAAIWARADGALPQQPEHTA